MNKTIKKILSILILVAILVLQSLLVFNSFYILYSIIIDEFKPLIELLPNAINSMITFTLISLILSKRFITNISKRATLILYSILAVLEGIVFVIFLTCFKYHFNGYSNRTAIVSVLFFINVVLLIYSFLQTRILQEKKQTRIPELTSINPIMKGVYTFISLFAFGLSGDALMVLFNINSYIEEPFFYPVLMSALFLPLLSLILTIFNKIKRKKSISITLLTLNVTFLILTFIMLSTQALVHVGQNIFFLDFAAGFLFMPIVMIILNVFFSIDNTINIIKR